VSHGKVDVEHPDELWMSLNDFPDALSSKGLLPKSGLDLVENLLVPRLGLVKYWVLSEWVIQEAVRRKRPTIFESEVS
jgi:hypothetical protein